MSNPQALISEMRRQVEIAQHEKRLAENPLGSFKRARHHAKRAQQALDRFYQLRAELLTQTRRSR